MSIVVGEGGAPLHFHKVMGSTGSRKDKINHLIWAEQVGGGDGICLEEGEIGGPAGELEGRVV